MGRFGACAVARGRDMGIAFLLLGLLPLAFLPDLISENNSDEADASEDETNSGPPDGVFGDLLADPLSPNAPNIEDDARDPDALEPPAEVVVQPFAEGVDYPDFEPAEGVPLEPVDQMDPTNSTIRLDFEDVVATGYVQISNFDTQSDVLEIIIEQASINAGLDVAVGPSADGQDGVVYVEGQLFAILSGAPDASLANLQAVIGDISG